MSYVDEDKVPHDLERYAWLDHASSILHSCGKNGCIIYKHICI